MNALANVVTAISTFLLGPFGISLITVGVAGAFLGAAIHMVPISYAYRAMYCGAGAFAAAWFVTLF